MQHPLPENVNRPNPTRPTVLPVLSGPDGAIPILFCYRNVTDLPEFGWYRPDGVRVSPLHINIQIYMCTISAPCDGGPFGGGFEFARTCLGHFRVRNFETTRTVWREYVRGRPTDGGHAASGRRGRHGLPPRCVKSSETPVQQRRRRRRRSGNRGRYREGGGGSGDRQVRRKAANRTGPSPLRRNGRGRKTAARGWLQWPRTRAHLTAQVTPRPTLRRRGPNGGCAEVSVQQFLFCVAHATRPARKTVAAAAAAVQLRWNRRKWSAATIPWSWTTYSTRARWNRRHAFSGCSAPSRRASYSRTSRWKSGPARWWPSWVRKVGARHYWRFTYLLLVTGAVYSTAVVGGGEERGPRKARRWF